MKKVFSRLSIYLCSICKIYYFLIVILFSYPNQLLGQDNFPLQFIKNSVIINIENRVPASGFYMNDSSKIYFVTAKHVLFDELNNSLWNDHATLSSMPDSIYSGEVVKLNVDLKNLYDIGKIKFSKTRDIAIMYIGVLRSDQKRITFSNNIQQVSGTSSLSSSHIGSIRLYNEVLIGNDIFIVNYPSSIGIKDIPQIDYFRPLLRKGIIAGKNELKKTIILDCPVYYGSSGSPVFQTKKVISGTYFYIVGVVLQFVPYNELLGINKDVSSLSSLYTNSGYSVIEPMDSVIKLMRTF